MNIINSVTLKSNNLQFTAKRQAGQSYSDFKRYDADSNFAAQIKNVITNRDNYISEGALNEVYAIPDNENFVVRVLKKKKEKFLKHVTPKLKELKDRFAELNVGQPIASYGDGVQVLIRQKGRQYGLFYLIKDENIKSSKDLYIKNVEQMAAIPQENYSILTDEIMTMRKKGCYIDVWNANNLLVDGNNLNIVDTNHFYNLYYKYVNRVTKKNLLRLLVDGKGLNDVMPYLNDADKVRLGKSMAIISEKLSTAMKHSKISEFKTVDKLIATVRDIFPRKIERTEKQIAALIKFAKG